LNAGEIDVLRLICRWECQSGGNANKENGAQLPIPEETVKGRVRSVLAKLDAKDRTHAAMIGLKRGIIEF